MAKLAIKGHATRGSELIKLLEMLGGVNGKIDKKTGEIYNIHNGRYFIDEICNIREVAYYIDFESQIRCIDIKDITTNFIVYSLEMFLKKYPYKVGDKVCFSDDLSTPFTINKMWWDENANELLCSFVEDDIEVPVDGVRAYKEEIIDMKEKILTLLREMTNDSKSVSHKAEKELCNILTEVINKLNAIEKKVGYYIFNYPDKIESIDDVYWYDELPKEIDCNDNDFCFKTEWLDINLQEYFEELREKRISGIKCTIAHVEYSLGKHREELERVGELKFEDLEI